MQSLRAYLDKLQGALPDQLITVEKPVDYECEITPHVLGAEKLESNPAIIFEKSIEAHHPY